MLTVSLKNSVSGLSVIDVQALAGDSVDNVPGVPGIRIKTAAQLIGEFGDLDALLARAEEIKQPKRRENLVNFAEQARISRDLDLAPRCAHAGCAQRHGTRRAGGGKSDGLFKGLSSTR